MPEHLTVRIKRFDKQLSLPSQQTADAAAFDLYARETTTIAPQSFGYIPLNVALEIPEHHWGMLVVRSSTHKHKIIPANGLGVFDGDFRGDTDEWKLIVSNVSQEEVTIERSVRIAQLMILPKPHITLEEVDRLESPNRGGIGSTGVL